jgi:hypothetical protein
MNAKRRQRSRIQAAVQVRFRAAGASTTRNLLMARMALLLRECGKPQARVPSTILLLARMARGPSARGAPSTLLS